MARPLGGTEVLVKPRPAVLRMHPYRPPLEGRQGFLRLDMNENTAGCSPAVLQALARRLTPEFLTIYPEYESSRATLAAAFGRAPEETLFTNGVDEAILLLLTTFVEPGQRVIVAEPCFDMYRFYASLAGVEVVAVERGPDLQFPLTRVRRAAGAPRRPGGTSPRAILVDNPNNPTGTALRPAQLEALARDFPHTLLLVDEAYYDFYGQTVLPLVGRYRNLVVTRTFSKAHGLAGLRFGCLFAHRETAAHLRKAQSPYSVNSLALAAACQAVRHRSYARRYARQVVASRKQFERQLRKMKIEYVPSSANFVLVRFGERAAAVQKGLRQRGILIRDRSSELPGSVRITLGTPAQMRRLMRNLRETLRALR